MLLAGRVTSLQDLNTRVDDICTSALIQHPELTDQIEQGKTEVKTQAVDGDYAALGTYWVNIELIYNVSTEVWDLRTWVVSDPDGLV